MARTRQDNMSKKEIEEEKKRRAAKATATNEPIKTVLGRNVGDVSLNTKKDDTKATEKANENKTTNNKKTETKQNTTKTVTSSANNTAPMFSASAFMGNETYSKKRWDEAQKTLERVQREKAFNQMNSRVQAGSAFERMRPAGAFAAGLENIRRAELEKAQEEDAKWRSFSKFGVNWNDYEKRQEEERKRSARRQIDALNGKPAITPRNTVRNPFLDKSGKLINVDRDYQAIIDEARKTGNKDLERAAREARFEKLFSHRDEFGVWDDGDYTPTERADAWYGSDWQREKVVKEEKQARAKEILEQRREEKRIKEEDEVLKKYGLARDNFSFPELFKWADERGFGVDENGRFYNPNKTIFGRDTGNKTYPTSEEERDLFILSQIASRVHHLAFAQEHPTAFSAYSVATAPIRGLAATVGNIQNSFNAAIGKPIDVHSPALGYVGDIQAGRQVVADEYASDWLGGKELPIVGNAGRFLYDTMMSMGDSTMNAAVGNMFGAGASTVTSFLMGNEAAASSVIYNKERGMSDEDALVLGLLSGAVEMLSEKIAFDEMLKKPKTFVTGIIKDFATEGLSEMAAEAGNIAIDTAFAGDNAEIRMAIKEYMAEGMTQKEATIAALRDSLNGVLSAGIAGGISGGITGGAYRGMTDAMLSGVGSEIISSGKINTVIEEGLSRSVESDVRKTAEAIQKKINAGEQVTPLEVGRMAADVVSTQNVAQKDEIGEYDDAQAYIEETTPLDLNSRAMDVPTEQNDSLAKAAIDVVNARNKVQTDGNVIEAISRNKTPTYEALEALSQNNEPIAVADVKKVTGFGDAGSVLVANLVNENGVTFSQATRTVENAYRAGMTGLDSNQVNLVTDTQKLAFKAGVEDRRVQNLAKQEKAKTATVYSTGFTENEYSAKLTSDEREMFSSISRDLKMDTKFADKLIAYYVNGKGREANASHSDGKMRVSSTSKLPMVSVAIHESFHRMRELDPQGTDALMNFLYESAEQNARRLELGVKGASWFDKIKEDYANVEGMDTIDYVEEVAAGRSEIIFSSAKEYNAWRASLEVNPQAKSSWQKLLETIKEVLEDLWAAITNSKMSLEAKRQAQKEIEIFSDAYRAAMKAADVRVAEQSAKRNYAKSLEIKTNKEYNGNTNYAIKAQRGRSIEIETMENNRFARLSHFRDDLPTEWYAYTNDYFYIYSNQSYTDYTMLLKVRLTENNKQAIDNFREDIKDGINGSAEIFDYWVRNFRRGRGRYIWNPISSSSKKATGRLDGVDVRPSRSDNVTDIERSGIHSESEVKNYSLKDSDGNTLTEAQQDYFRDSKVRDENGNLLVVYHGSSSKFTVFDHKHINTHGNAHGRGFYFTENKSLAEGYNKDDGQLLKGYLNIENPLSEEKITIKKPALVKLIKATCEEQAKSLVEDDGYKNVREALPDTWVSNYVNTYGMSIADAYKEVANIIYSGSDNDVDIIAELTNAGAGYDTTLKLTHDILGYDGVIYENEDGYHEFVSLISNQFKSIDNANPSANADINFSLKENNSISSKDRRELLDIIEHLKSEFELTKFAKADPKKLAKMTRDLLKEYSSQADFDETYKAIDELYTYMANGKDGHNPAWEEVYDRAYRIAQGIAENALVVDNYAYQEYNHLRDYLRTTPMKFNPDYDSVPYSYENFNEFRKLNMGRLKFTKDGMGIDSVYQELSHLYPEFFDSAEQTNSADQLERIVDVLDELRPTERNPFDRELEQVSMYLANDLTSRFFDVPQARPTFADKAERRVIEANIKGRKKLDALREQKDAKIKKLLETQKEKTKKQLDKLREQRDAKVKKEQEKRRNAISKMSENQKAKVLRARIMRHTSDLSKKLVNPTDNQHIPHELQGAVAKLLECINLESNYTYDAESHSYKKNDEGLPTRRTQAFNELRVVYANIASSVVVDPDLMGEYGLLSGVISLADKRLADMTPSELDTVWQAIRAIEASVNTANKLFSDGKFATIFEVADTLRSQNEGKASKTEFKGIIGKGKNLATLDMLTPETYLHYLGDAGDSIFRMMRDAQDKHISIMKEVSDFTHKALKDVDVNSLEKTMHTVTLGGEDIQLSTAQLMELYVLMNREQAQEHILIGGILPDVTESKGIKLITQAKPTRNISIAEVSAAISNLTDEQKKIADKLQTYASTVLSTYGNEASMQVYNYEKFHEEHYWPIRTNRQEIQTDVDKDTSVTTVANKGMTKATKPHANTSVRIGSIFDTFSSHASDMATYAAWLGTSEDVNRIRNFVFWEDGARTGTVKGILDTVHGKQGSQYFEKLLTDVAIGVKGTDNMNPLDKFVGNYKAASVGANLRVIIQQPTAILRALDMLDARYLTAGAVRPLKGWGKAKKHAPIAQWKDWGYFDINTGRQMKDVLFDNASLLEKIKQVGMWGASMADSFAWGHLWNAVEAEIKSTRKELEVGTDAYYKAVAKRFTEIVDHTQVVDGILQRSQIMRSADGLTKMATSFMGEPTKQYNMAMSAFYDFKTGRGDARKSAAVKLGRTALALATAGIINACAQSIIDAMRDDDKEKKYWERWLRAFAGDGDEAKWYDTNLADTANPLNYIPFAKDIVSIVRGYDVKRMDTEAITKVFDATKNMYKSVTGEGKYTIAEASAQLFAEISRLYGVPVANVKRDVKSLVTSVAIETDSYVMQYRMEKAMLNINYAGNSKNFTDILFNAYINDREAYEVIYNDMLKNGFDADKIKNGMESRMKKAEGVEKSTELSKRYMSPDVEKVYDAGIKRAESNKVWKLASDEQIQEAKNNLYSFLASPSDEQKAKREEARAYDVDETDIILWELASEMADDAGKDNDYVDAKEKKAALEMLELGNSEIAYFYDTKTSAKAYDNDIDMYRFAMFMGAISGIEGKGKTDKIKALANEYAADHREYVFFVGSGLSNYKKKPDYIRYFGAE